MKLSKVVVFLAKTVAPVWGITLATLKREGGTFSGLALLAFQKWWFFWQKEWHWLVFSKGLVGLGPTRRSILGSDCTMKYLERT